MDLLSVAPHLPYEGVPHAGGVYLLRHLQFIAQQHRVVLVVPASPETLKNIHRAPDWLELVLGPVNPATRTTARRLRDAAYHRLMGSPPAPTAESLRGVLDTGLVERAHNAQLVELHWPEYARFATILRRAGVRTPISVVEHDVDIAAAAQRLRRYGHGYRRILGLATVPLTQHIEARGLRDADLVLVFKAADEKLLRRTKVRTPVRIIDPWLDEPPGAAAAPMPRSVLFTGAMWRRANEDGVIWFLQRVWPRVRSAVPDAAFTVAGAGPTGRLRRIAAEAGNVEITGEVPDLLPFYRRAALFVAPLFVGGGLKFKVAQAMLCGLPVVATSSGVQGISDSAPPGVLWGITDDAEGMAEAVVSALRDVELAATVGRAAARWCRERYSFSRSMQGVLDEYAALVTPAIGSDQH